MRSAWTRSNLPKPQVLDSGLSDRSRRHAPALGGPRKNHRILSGILRCHRRRTGFEDCVRLLRFLKGIREKCSEALHILDRFHIVAKMNKALDEIRAGESRRMASEGDVPALKKSCWLLLKREENLKTEQRFRLRDLLRYNLKTVRAYLLRKPFSSSRITTRPHGPQGSSMTGVGK
jgi:Transposase